MDEIQPLLRRSSEDERPLSITTEMTGPTLGKIRAYWLGSVVCMGGFLFGYDSGIVG
ncbi:uncharacterized protein F4817DRAFT_179207 [Daldinia loculata]|uniref:uncharacterized protein n=1 Tax=Daldinia loculata TaxID=103429 RepID=UPI0020C50C1C|nr:uncharacterized protein F4817DRAFT_179207 [Daldinia loculata]KAI1651227.1 hypothetical protein F4817DRAFT_179207 [Daldinia loculata]